MPIKSQDFKRRKKQRLFLALSLGALLLIFLASMLRIGVGSAVVNSDFVMILLELVESESEQTN